MKRTALAIVAAVLWSLALSACAADVSQPAQQVVIRAGRFCYAVSPITGSAAWVSECLTPECLVGNAQRKNFTVDRNLPEDLRARGADYQGSGYDIGHLPAAANYRGDQFDMDATFRYTTAVPMIPELNRGIYSVIERAVRDEVKPGRFVHVVTIPLYNYGHDRGIKRAGRVLVPTEIAKAVYIEGPLPRMFGWIVPNVAPRQHAADEYKTTVDTIEERSFLDLFSWVDNETQNRLEAAP